MDVTFFENQPFYFKTDIHGEEIQNNSQEYQFWSIPTIFSSQ